MITMMEKYTDHLEDIVAERTSELAAEKAKTDELLYRMLPRYQGYIVPRSVKLTNQAQRCNSSSVHFKQHTYSLNPTLRYKTYLGVDD